MSVQHALRIVQMHALEIFEADLPAKLLHHCFIGIFQVVAGGERMAGVKADPHPAWLIDQFDQPRQFLERRTDVAPLPRRVLDHRADPFGFRQHRLHFTRDQFQTILHRDLAQMAARMEIQVFQTQLHAARHLVQKRLARPLPFFHVRIAQIDQIAVVRQDLICCEPVVLTILFERHDGFGCQRRRFPLPLVFREHGERFRADRRRIQRRVFHAAQDGYMCSDIFHFPLSGLYFDFQFAVDPDRFDSGNSVSADIQQAHCKRGFAHRALNQKLQSVFFEQRDAVVIMP